MDEQRQRKTLIAGDQRVEVVDNWHKQWPQVLALIDRLGQRASLQLDADGWLSARQSVVAAFVDGEPAAHLTFHVWPVNRETVEAHVDAVGFDGATARSQLGAALRDVAQRHARMLRCRELKGLDVKV